MSAPTDHLAPFDRDPARRDPVPGVGVRDLVDRTRLSRKEIALARLAARRMPLPGRPYPTPSVRLPAAENFVGTVPEVDHTRSPIVPASSVSMTARPENRPDLTDREIEVLCAWLQLDSKPAVAQELFISLGTVNTHLTRIRAKYADCGRAARTKAALVARAVQDGLISLDDL